uniref:RING-type E3 ubiquitin transferase n=1 Tax=Kalanchoe fedtschenkoi TaxID=63787 RepID=A0A7N0RIW3_KALFE
MEDAKSSESHLISAVAYVEAGVQDACDDACSICLEAFNQSEPSTMTTCKHEFHLQCILEWCQRSSQCPMCWQAISLKDPGSQELLDAVEHERHILLNPPRTATVFRHPTLGEFEIPVGVTDAELEERIIQHLAAAAAMRRGRRIVRREGQRSRPSAHDHPHVVLSSSQNTSPGSHATQSPSNGGESERTPVFVTSPRPDQVSTPPHGSSGIRIVEAGLPSNQRTSPVRLSPSSQDREGPSEGQSFSDTVKSRLTAVSTRYKESITKSTRGWRERLFSRNTSVADLGSEVKREVNAGIATVSRMMERLGTKENETATSTASVSNSAENESVQSLRNQQVIETTSTSGVNGTRLPSPCAPPYV